MRADHVQKHVVIEDLTGQYWEGALVNVENELPALRARGVITLPIDEEALLHSAVAGYFRRSWGSGWPIGSALPRFACPMMLFVLAAPANGPGGMRRINFAARLVPDENLLAVVQGGGRVAGTLRLAADSGQPGVFSAGFSAAEDTTIAGHELPPPDARGGWTVRGGGIVNAPTNGLMGFALYGAMPGMRVAWAAISQSR